jgi:hypothetical protein
VAVREGPLPAVPGHECLEVLGKGGMGIVSKAWHLGLKRTVDQAGGLVAERFALCQALPLGRLAAVTKGLLWKADIQRFFPCVDHDTLNAQLARKVKDPEVLGLAGLIIDHSPVLQESAGVFPGDDLFTPAQRRGLPIGNQTSQFFANVYLDPLDHFVKDRLCLGRPANTPP